MTAARDDGFVLVAVLWLLALLGGLTMAMSLATTSSLSALDAYNGRPRGAAAIEAGLNQAVAAILPADAPPAGQGAVTVGTARVTFAWVAETARIDANLAPAELLAGLFATLGETSDAAAGAASRIVALRGLPAGDRQPAPGRPQGYDPNEETPEAIAALARGGQPKPGESDPHKPLIDVVQLQQVPGLPPALMARAEPYLTVFSGIAQVDARLAAPEVIAALPGMTRERLRGVLAARGRGDDPQALADALGDARTFTTDKPGRAVRIKVVASLPDGFTTAAEIVIVHYPDDRQAYRVLSWDDDVQSRATPVKDTSP